MERLWAPWRMQYVESATGGEPEDCLFCRVLAADDDEANYVLARTGGAFAILNAFPYNPGHLMVAPGRHVGELGELSEAELIATSEMLRRSVGVLRASSNPDGFNLGMNLGQMAGAGIPGHLHWHVVPRWNGDTNFMPVVGETKVLPELLSETYARLKPLF
ncbi:MAG: HIT domain-containing protein [Actinobacteria bacterium]|nr:MAG: HIT domain-containing protein [Actinomycetota bacterium]